ncbi:MAG: hypothetical protein DYG92_12045 [Leptolyngbya sp. PLA1]|nr:hypothetical protein [Leptolyngbya sp. PLA1]
MLGNRRASVVFGLSVGAILAALAWVTVGALRLERAEREARALARHQEALRLALWRMDAAVTPIIAREAARPYYEYQPFFLPGGQALTPPATVDQNQVLVASPLLQPPDPLVLLNFQKVGSGDIESPQAPTGVYRLMAEPSFITGYELAQNDERLDLLRKAQAGPQMESTLSADAALPESLPAPQTAARVQALNPGQVLEEQQAQSAREYEARQRVNIYSNAPQVSRSRGETATKDVLKDEAEKDAAAKQVAGPVDEAAGKDDGTSLHAAPSAAPAQREQNATGGARDKKLDRGAGFGTPGWAESPAEQAPLQVATVAPPELHQGPFVAKWVSRTGEDPRLIFEREVKLHDQTGTQGFLIDWPALRTTLLDSIRDLFPTADLRPLLRGVDRGSDPAVLGRALAVIPAELVVDSPAPAPLPWLTPLRATLLLAWVGLLVAVMVIGLTLRTANELAERRGQFVSAVTHELRTPLTTFVMYSQMLADGMIRGEEDRATYLGTLKTESQRLARIVESVLDYARLSKRRHAPVRTRLSAEALVESLRPVLEGRAAQAGMQLVVDREGDLTAPVETDPGTLERILYNLVDNACKYAGEAEDKRIHLVARSRGGEVVLSVRDHGPGVPDGEAASVFRPFTRGSGHAHGSTPGLGLGLAICRSLAKDLGGELKLVPAREGAEFALRLPRA